MPIAGSLYKRYPNGVVIRLVEPNDNMEDAAVVQRTTEFRIYRGSFCMKVMTNAAEAEAFAESISHRTRA